jgi:hypothetical protein
MRKICEKYSEAAATRYVPAKKRPNLWKRYRKKLPRSNYKDMKKINTHLKAHEHFNRLYLTRELND